MKGERSFLLSTKVPLLLLNQTSVESHTDLQSLSLFLVKERVEKTKEPRSLSWSRQTHTYTHISDDQLNTPEKN